MPESPIHKIPAAIVNITAVDVYPISGNQDEEYIQITNPNAKPSDPTLYSAYAVDISGWTLTGGVNFTFPGGTVIAPGESLYVSPNTKAFRLRTSSPKGGESLFVIGPYDGHLSALGETIL